MKIWFKQMKDSRLLAQETIEDNSAETRTHKIMNAIEEVCHIWDLECPYWLKANERDFLARASTRFTKDNFINEIPFDYMEIAVLEEDWIPR